MIELVHKLAKSQIEHTLKEIESLLCSEFPYNSSKEALIILQNIFNTHKEKINLLDENSDPSTISLACNSAITENKDYLDLFGFILRSTNIRNAFEVYGPLLRLCRELLGNDIKLIISSEWSFSAYTYIGFKFLSNFVFIGLPAPQSSNSFLLPIAGHEIGHNLWSTNNIENDLSQKINTSLEEKIKETWDTYIKIFPQHKDKKEELLTDLITRLTWSEAYNLCSAQLEESFCDLVGIRLFGSSYLYAYAYARSSLNKEERIPIYPNHKDRVIIMAKYCDMCGINIDKEYIDAFSNMAEPSEDYQRELYMIQLADYARQQLIDDIISKVDSFINKETHKNDNQASEQCLKSFKMMVPCQNSNGLHNILNAAWKALLEDNFFKNKEAEDKKEAALNEIVLKSIEVLEIEQILNSSINAN